jgi:glycosyltransferase involved in cell wall biosynthesis
LPVSNPSIAEKSTIPAEVSVIVLTYNEEQNLEACLESVTGWVRDVYLVDSGSNDRTVEIGKQFGARIYNKAFETHAKQWNWALGNLPLATQWILALDADQRVTPELAREISKLFELGGESPTAKEANGFYIKRRQIFRTKWIRHGGYYPKYLLKLFRRDKVRIDTNDLVDHHFYVIGSTPKLSQDLIESNKKEDNISFWIDKHNRYATLLAREELSRRTYNPLKPITPSLLGNPDQRILWLKRFWYRLPLYLRPHLYFSYRYFFRMGFLDGRQGFIFHFLQSYWFRLLVDIKLDELRRERKSVVGAQQN